MIKFLIKNKIKTDIRYGGEIMGKVAISSDLKELIPNFMKNRKKEINRIDEAYKNKEFEKIAIEAHKIKGVTGSYGFSYISEIAGGIEVAANRSEIEEILNLLIKLKKEIEECEIEFIEEE